MYSKCWSMLFRFALPPFAIVIALPVLLNGVTISLTQSYVPPFFFLSKNSFSLYIFVGKISSNLSASCNGASFYYGLKPDAYNEIAYIALVFPFFLSFFMRFRKARLTCTLRLLLLIHLQKFLSIPFLASYSICWT